MINTPDAVKAVLQQNGVLLHGKPIRVCHYIRDSDKRRSVASNIVIKQLPKHHDITGKVTVAFSAFGDVISVKVPVDKETLIPHGYGYVNFDSPEAAQRAIQASLQNKISIDGIPVIAEPYTPHQSVSSTHTFTNIYVKNIPLEWTSDDLNKFCSQFGEIVSAAVAPDSTNSSLNRGFGYVNFSMFDSAHKAIETINSMEEIGNKNGSIMATKHVPKAERDRQKREITEQVRSEKYLKYGLCNQYIKGLPVDMAEERLNEMFAKYGTIISSKLVLSPTGIPTGVAYVCYSTPEEAMEAIMLLNNKVVNGSTLFVAHHQPKAIREAQQLPVVRSHPPYPAAMPPIMYYQMPPMGTTPPQFAPYPPRRYMRPATNKTRTNRTTNKPRRPLQLQNQSFSLAQTVKNLPTEEEKKQFLGETLFYKVQSLDAENAPKITGMLLEMEIPEIIALCESPNELLAEVQEAQMILNEEPQQ